MTRTKFVRPGSDDRTPLEAAKQLLVHHGLDMRRAELVALLFLAVASGENAEIIDVDDFDRLFAHLAGELEGLDAPDVCVLRAGLSLAVEATRFACWNRDRAQVATRVVDHLAGLGRDLSGALGVLLAQPEQADELRWTSLLAKLLEHGLIDPCKFLNRELILTTTKGIPGRTWNQTERERDPGLPDFWVSLDPGRAMASFARLLEDEPRDSVGVLAYGLERSLLLDNGRELHEHLEPLARLLCERWQDGRQRDRILTRCCWSYGQKVPGVTTAAHEELRELALAELGRMRRVLRSDNAASRFDTQRDYMTQAIFFVLRTEPGSLWPVVRRLLLALRDLRLPAVPPDLRTWDEPGRDAAPMPWGQIPKWIANVLEFFLGRELDRDPDLQKIRSEFARFLLDRLKTSGRTSVDEITNESLVDPDPVWRLGYLHALQELHVNPGGRGHNLLAWSIRHDPDEQVQEEARRAHSALRRRAKLPGGTSPRRVFYAAFWWLRQAHLLSLGLEPDDAGAKRTHAKEVRRSRQLDQQ